MVLHNFEELGGTVLYPNVATVCVEGLDNMVTVMPPPSRAMLCRLRHQHSWLGKLPQQLQFD